MGIIIKPVAGSKTAAVLLALLVTFLWSTSFIIIKNGLDDIPPLTFAGLRYFIAALALIPFVLKNKGIEKIRKISKADWGLLILLGLLFYTATQGIQFIGLSMISTVTVSLMLNFTPLIVVVLGFFLLNERPGILQVTGIIVFLIGILLYFRPSGNNGNEGAGVIVMAFGVVANAVSAVLGRKINMKKQVEPVLITFISMFTGGTVLLVVGLAKDGFPMLDLQNLFSLLWLAFINTAFAFTLWNISLRTLTAMESSIINGTMLIQIAVLSVIFLDVELSVAKVIALLITAAGAVFVQIRKVKG